MESWVDVGRKSRSFLRTFDGMAPGRALSRGLDEDELDEEPSLYFLYDIVFGARLSYTLTYRRM